MVDPEEELPEGTMSMRMVVCLDHGVAAAAMAVPVAGHHRRVGSRDVFSTVGSRAGAQARRRGASMLPLARTAGCVSAYQANFGRV